MAAVVNVGLSVRRTGALEQDWATEMVWEWRNATVTYLLTYLFTYLLTYLLTYSLHAAQSFLRS